jgi:hypothetical protein
MSNWNMASEDGTIAISLTCVDENGNIQAPSTVWFQGVTYQVIGRWVASALGRANASGFYFGSETAAPNPLFLAASGIMVGPGPSPTSITISVTQASTSDSSQQQYEGELFPNEQFSMPTGGWVVTLDDGTVGTLNLSKAANGTLSPIATWAYPSGTTAVSAVSTWTENELSWWGGGVHYGSGVWNPTTGTFTGEYTDRLRQNGVWTATQGK